MHITGPKGPFAVPEHGFRGQTRRKNSMSIKALQDVWDRQFPLLNDRVKTSWFRQLNYIQGASTEADVNEAGMLAKGFVAALSEADLVDEEGARLMGTTLLRVGNDAFARIRAAGIVGQASSHIFLKDTQ
ncbi:hypothetical protein [Pseudomonas chlororaphis]|uniref:hypothetical protein n=1 Tax=Pseudomonas chlororaphis TaxID=587753 RepID=UPI002D76B9B1|nr:hypothetical protein [Pseudomonas chlororaphis]